MGDHPLRARVEWAAEFDALEQTEAVLAALSHRPMTVSEVAEAIGAPPEDGDALRATSKRLTHLCRRYAAREMVIRVGARPDRGSAAEMWDLVGAEGMPLVLVATNLQRSVQRIRYQINSYTQNARQSASGALAVARAWVITDSGRSILGG